MSELELSLFRQRSQEALRQKARRGALFLGVAAGYVKTGRDRIEKDPDQQVRDAVGIVFAKFAELQSVRQVHVWLREEGIALPTARHSAAEGRIVVCRSPCGSSRTIPTWPTSPMVPLSRRRPACRYRRNMPQSRAIILGVKPAQGALAVPP